MLSISERYDNYVNTINDCRSHILTLDDEHLMYTIFEKLSIDIPCYLHLNSLNLFLDEGIIDLEIFNCSEQLREHFLLLERNYNEKGNAQGIRESNEWRALFAKADSIFDLLYYLIPQN